MVNTYTVLCVIVVSCCIGLLDSAKPCSANYVRPFHLIDCQIAYKETGDTILPDPCDCSAFYICQRLSEDQQNTINIDEEFNAVRMKCPTCTEWDHLRLSCSVIPDPECLDTNYVLANSTVVADCPLMQVENDTRAFYHGDKIMQCAHGTYINFTLCACVMDRQMESNRKNSLEYRSGLVTCLTFDEDHLGSKGEFTQLTGDARVTRDASANCKAGGCLEMNGRASLQLDFLARILHNLKEFTISFWLRIDVPQESGILGNIACNSKQAPTLLTVQHVSGRLQSAMFNSRQQMFSGYTYLLDDDWHHYVIRYNGTTFSNYLDGELTDEVQFKGKPKGNSIPLTFGRPRCSNRFIRGELIGALDQICIYRRALPEASIADLSTNATLSHVYFFTDY